MSESAVSVARRLVDLFNRTFGQGRFEAVDEARSLYAEEPVIVPLRAALEGTRYEGPEALDNFIADSAEIWKWLRLEDVSARDLSAERVLLTATLTGVGRESGAEVTMPAAWLIEVREGRITAVRTFTSEREALEAAG